MTSSSRGSNRKKTLHSFASSISHTFIFVPVFYLSLSFPHSHFLLYCPFVFSLRLHVFMFYFFSLLSPSKKRSMHVKRCVHDRKGDSGIKRKRGKNPGCMLSAFSCCFLSFVINHVIP